MPLVRNPANPNCTHFASIDTSRTSARSGEKHIKIHFRGSQQNVIVKSDKHHMILQKDLF